jgi:hypothetical protein
MSSGARMLKSSIYRHGANPRASAVDVSDNQRQSDSVKISTGKLLLLHKVEPSTKYRGVEGLLRSDH